MWAKSGKELFYRSGRKLISLFEGDFATGDGTSGYDVSPDGQRFYFIQEDKKSGQQAKST